MNRTDEEEVELLKRVWSEYGKPAIYGVAITMAVVFGYKAYQKHQHETASAASALYQNLLETTQAGQLAEPLNDEQKTTMAHVVSNLQDDYSGTRYAVFASMIQAQQQVQDNDLESARASLEWVLNNKPEAEVEQIARVRLARVILSQGDDQAQAALDVLSGSQSNEAFTSSVEGVRGDAYLALGQVDQARIAYQKALDAARVHGETLPILQFKLDDLAVNEEEG